MARRSNHYDAAFEQFLRATRVPYVAVDEQRRALMRDVSLKSLDFIVYSERTDNLLIDVKGRRFPTGVSQPHWWENWASDDDLSSMMQWQQVFGGGFRAMLVFAYDIVVPERIGEFESPFAFRNRTYAFFGVWVDEYHAQMRRRSPRWETVSVSRRSFRRLSAPIHAFL